MESLPPARSRRSEPGPSRRPVPAQRRLGASRSRTAPRPARDGCTHRSQGSGRGRGRRASFSSSSSPCGGFGDRSPPPSLQTKGMGHRASGIGRAGPPAAPATLGPRTGVLGVAPFAKHARCVVDAAALARPLAGVLVVHRVGRPCDAGARPEGHDEVLDDIVVLLVLAARTAAACLRRAAPHLLEGRRNLALHRERSGTGTEVQPQAGAQA